MNGAEKMTNIETPSSNTRQDGVLDTLAPLDSDARPTSWFHYFEHVIKMAQEGLIGVLIVMNRDNSSQQRSQDITVRLTSYILLLTSTLVDAFQMLSFVFRSHDDVALEQVSQIFNIFEFSTLFVSWFGYVATLVVTTVIVGGELVNVVYIAYCWANKRVQNTYSVAVLKYTSALLVGNMYIPFLTIFSRTLKCEDEVYSDVGMLDTIPIEVCRAIRPPITILMLLFVGLSLIASASFFDSSPLSRGAGARPHSRVDLVYLVVKTFTTLECSFVCDVDETSVIVRMLWSGSLMLLYTILAYLFIWYQPFYNPSVVRVKAVTISAVAWISILEFAHMILKVVHEQQLFQVFPNKTSVELLAMLEHSNFQGVRFWFLGFSSVIMPIGIYLLVQYRQRLLVNEKYEDCAHIFELEIRARVDARQIQTLHSKLEANQTRAQDDTIQEATQEDSYHHCDDKQSINAELNDVLSRMIQGFEHGMQKFHNSSLICLFYIEALVAFGNQETKTILIRKAILEAESRNPPVDVRLALQRKREYLKQLVSGNSNAVSYALAQQYENVGRQTDARACVLLNQFWTQVTKQDDASLNHLMHVAGRIATNILRARSSYTELIKIHSQDPGVMQLYAGFLSDVCNDKHEAKRYFSKAQRLGIEQQEKRPKQAGEQPNWSSTVQQVLRTRPSILSSASDGRSSDELSDTNASDQFSVVNDTSPAASHAAVIRISIGICHSPFGEIQSANKAAEELLEVGFEQLTGDDFLKYLPSPLAHALRDIIHEFFQTGTSWLISKGINTVVISAENAIMPCHLRFTPMTEDGMMYTMFVQITPSKINEWETCMLVDEDLRITQASKSCEEFFQRCSRDHVKITNVTLQDLLQNYHLSVPVTMRRPVHYVLRNPVENLIRPKPRRKQHKWKLLSKSKLFHLQLTYQGLPGGQSRKFTQSTHGYNFRSSILLVKVQPLVPLPEPIELPVEVKPSDGNQNRIDLQPNTPLATATSESNNQQDISESIVNKQGSLDDLDLEHLVDAPTLSRAQSDIRLNSQSIEANLRTQSKDLAKLIQEQELLHSGYAIDSPYTRDDKVPHDPPDSIKTSTVAASTTQEIANNEWEQGTLSTLDSLIDISQNSDNTVTKDHSQNSGNTITRDHSQTSENTVTRDHSQNSENTVTKDHSQNSGNTITRDHSQNSDSSIAKNTNETSRDRIMEGKSEDRKILSTKVSPELIHALRNEKPTAQNLLQDDQNSVLWKEVEQLRSKALRQGSTSTSWNRNIQVFHIRLGFYALFSLIVSVLLHEMVDDGFKQLLQGLSLSQSIGKEADLVVSITTEAYWKSLVSHNITLPSQPLGLRMTPQATDDNLEQYSSHLNKLSGSLYLQRSELEPSIENKFSTPAISLFEVRNMVPSETFVDLDEAVKDTAACGAELARMSLQEFRNSGQGKLAMLLGRSGILPPEQQQPKEIKGNCLLDELLQQMRLQAFAQIEFQLYFDFYAKACTVTAIVVQIFIVFGTAIPLLQNMNERKLLILKVFSTFPIQAIEGITQTYKLRLYSVHQYDIPGAHLFPTKQTELEVSKEKGFSHCESRIGSKKRRNGISTNLNASSFRVVPESRQSFKDTNPADQSGGNSPSNVPKNNSGRLENKFSTLKLVSTKLELRKLACVTLYGILYFVIFFYLGVYQYQIELHLAPARLALSSELTVRTNLALGLLLVSVTKGTLSFNGQLGHVLEKAQVLDEFESLRMLVRQLVYADRTEEQLWSSQVYPVGYQPLSSFQLSTPLDEFHKLWFDDSCIFFEQAIQNREKEMEELQVQQESSSTTTLLNKLSNDGCNAEYNRGLSSGMRVGIFKLSGRGEVLLQTLDSLEPEQHGNKTRDIQAGLDILQSASYIQMLLHNSNEFAQLLSFGKGYVHPLLRESVGMVEQQISEIAIQSATNRVTLLMASSTLSGLIYLFVILPMLRALDRDVKQMRSLLLMIPNEIAQGSIDLQHIMLQELNGD